MKRANFPGRKNIRRKGALQMLGDNPKSVKERKRLEELIVPEEIARTSRSKKNRSGSAKMFRN